MRTRSPSCATRSSTSSGCAARIAYIDPIDLQYNRFDRVPKPTTQAVMFCLMDASASMTEPLKDLAKRFFMLLHVFLTRYYREVHLVFIRHTSTAAEVDEETFFRGTETGGTVISTRARRDAEGRARALFAGRLEHLCGAGLRRRQLPRRHAALPGAARRGDPADLPVLRLYRDRRTASASTTRVETPVWHGYAEVARRQQNFAMRRVASPEDIFPVFHELFSADSAAA